MISIKYFSKNNLGATLIEYSLIGSIIGLGTVATFPELSTNIKTTYCTVSYAMSDSLSPGCRVSLQANVIVNGPFVSTGIFLRKGQTVKITPEGEWTVSQYGGKNGQIRQNDPFNVLNHADATKNLTKADYSGVDSNGKKYRFSVFGAQVMEGKGNDYDTNYNHDPSKNMSIAQNGNVTITAQSDGYLYAGIHDDYAADNTFAGDNPKINIYLTAE